MSSALQYSVNCCWACAEMFLYTLTHLHIHVCCIKGVGVCNDYILDSFSKLLLLHTTLAVLLKLNYCCLYEKNYKGDNLMKCLNFISEIWSIKYWNIFSKYAVDEIWYLLSHMQVINCDY